MRHIIRPPATGILDVNILMTLIAQSLVKVCLSNISSAANVKAFIFVRLSPWY